MLTKVLLRVLEHDETEIISTSSTALYCPILFKKTLPLSPPEND